MIHLTGGSGVERSSSAVIDFRKFCKSHLHHPFNFKIYTLSHIIVILCVVSFTLVVSCTARAAPQPHKRAKRRFCG